MVRALRHAREIRGDQGRSGEIRGGAAHGARLEAREGSGDGDRRADQLPMQHGARPVVGPDRACGWRDWGEVEARLK